MNTNEEKENKLTKEQEEILEKEGYELIKLYREYGKNGRFTRRFIIKHRLCGKEYDTRVSRFFTDGQRCSCLRKRSSAKIKDTEDFNQYLSSTLGEGEYIAVSQYLGRKKPIIIKHKCGHEYEIKRAEYLLDPKEASGRCPICHRGSKTSIEAINQRFKNAGLNIEIDESETYVPSKTEYLIHNLECGHKYKKSYIDILAGKTNCPVCLTKYRKDIDIDYVKNEIHSIDSSYTVLSDEYQGTHELLSVHHDKCGRTYNVSRTNFLSGKRCPHCSVSKGYSAAEIEILNFIKSFYPNTDKYKEYTNGKLKYEIDIFIPELKIGFEYDGIYWHGDNKKDKNYHIDKTKYFDKQGIRIVHIFSDEWETKKDIVKDKIKAIIGVQTNKIYARKCTVKEVSSIDRNAFLRENHIQGPDSAVISYGLYYENELVAVMSLSKLRKALGQTNKAGVYELSRYAGKIDYTVIGGFNKLLSHIISEHSEVGTIKTYADIRWTKLTDNVYDKNGFTLTHISEPSYTYTKDFRTREYRFKYRKQVLKDKFPEIYSDSKTEAEIMSEAGYSRIYDCGNLVYTLDIQK